MRRLLLITALALLFVACAPPAESTPAPPTATITPSETPPPTVPFLEAVEPTASASTRTPWPTATPTLSPDEADYPMRFEEAGQLGGLVRGLALQGEVVYLAVGPRLLTVDVSDPANPLPLGRSDVLPEVMEAVAVSGDHAFTVSPDGVLRAFDISDPALPRLVDEYVVSGALSGLAIIGDYVFLAADGAGLQVVDISDPAHMRPAGGLYIASDGRPLVADAIATVGDRAYLLTRGDVGVIHVIDLSVPTAPSALGLLDEVYANSYLSRGFDAWENTVYVGANVYDFSDVSQPRPVGHNMGEQSHYAIAAYGGYVYNMGIKTFTPYPVNWFGVLDARDPADYEQLLEDSAALPDGVIADSQWIVVRGRYAYVVHELGLRVFDVGQPPDVEIVPYQLSEIAIPTWAMVGEVYPGVSTLFRYCCGWRPGRQMVVQGDYLYTLAASDLFALSLADPAAPEITDWEAMNGWMFVTAMNDVIVSYGGWAADISDPAHPQAIAEPLRTFGDISGNIAYNADSRSVAVYDVSDPYQPVKLGEASLPETHDERAYDVVVAAGDHVYVNEFIVDATNPTHPRLLDATQDVWSEFYGPRMIDDDVLYMVVGWFLEFVDISDPAAPQRIGRMFLPGLVGNDVSQLATGEDGIIVVLIEGPEPVLYAVDVSDLENPAIVGFRTLASAENMAVYGDYVYVGSTDYGIQVFHLDER